MSPLPVAIHTAEQVRELDRYVIETLQIPGYTLMSRAGSAALAIIKEAWPRARRIVIVCGPGNNGGDGYVLARLAREQGLDACAVSIADTGKLRSDAARAYQDFTNAGGVVHPWGEGALDSADLIVDAVFGTGLSRDLDARIISVIDTINGSGVPVLALDVPSGLHSDTGAILGAAIRATRTLTFIGLKLGFYLGQGPDHTGAITLDDLAVPAAALTHIAPAALRIAEDEIARALPARPRTAHKGQNGDVLIVGGGIGMAGAARLAGEAALRSGAGRVTVATRPENVATIVAARPELMCRGVQSAEDLQPLIARADIVAIGPGLGQDEWSRAMLDGVLDAQRPLVMDADALNLLAQRGAQPHGKAARIMTPHPGEAGRLLGITTAQVQADRLGAARAIAQRYGAIVVLKGAGSIVVEPAGLPSICDRGNPGMASPGMGDVLTGVIAGIAAQVRDAAVAARVGVLAHALAGDRAAQRGERGIIASDLFEHLPACLNRPRSS